jgi:Carboxypeptidase regulatory-like domain
MRLRASFFAVLGGAALLLVGTGCSSVEKLSFPNPPATQAPGQGAAPTLPDNLSSVTQPPVAGVTTTTVPVVGPGAATLNGSVFGPTGPVGGATVEADRLVGNQVASARTITAADGSWKIPNILGGIYRVRAWHAPNLDLATPQVLYLGDNQNLTVSIELTAFPGPNVGTSIAPATPLVGQAANLLVQVTTPNVAANGVLTYQPVAAGLVQLTPGPGWTVSGANPAPTDAAGNVLFHVQCVSAGSSPIIATVGAKGTPVSLQVPPCTPAPAPTTTTTAPCPSTTSVPPGNPNNPTLGVGGCG